jgi:hypothetical protein
MATPPEGQTPSSRHQQNKLVYEVSDDDRLSKADRGLGSLAPPPPLPEGQEPNIDEYGVNRDVPPVYGGGWQPEPLTKPSDEPVAPHHAKINRYHVVRNTKEYYTFSIEPHVVKADDITKAEWTCADAKKLQVTSAGGFLTFLKLDDEGAPEEYGAQFKLPKAADPESELLVVTPDKGGLFVTVLKRGVPASTLASIPKLSDELTGDGPRICTLNGVHVKPEDMMEVSNSQPRYNHYLPRGSVFNGSWNTPEENAAKAAAEAAAAK